MNYKKYILNLKKQYGVFHTLVKQESDFVELERKLENKFYIQSFRREIKKLKKVCSLYDEGETLMSDYIALSLRHLIYDYGEKTQSLLSKLNIKNTIQFLDSRGKMIGGASYLTFGDNISNQALNFPENIKTPAIRKKYIQVGEKLEITFSPMKSPLWGSEADNRKLLSFNEWYNDDVFQIETGNQVFRRSRKDILDDFVHKDGGAHYDFRITGDQFYQLLKDGLILAGTSNISKTTSNSIEATVRHIAYEVIESIDRQEEIIRRHLDKIV